MIEWEERKEEQRDAAGEEKHAANIIARRAQPCGCLVPSRPENELHTTYRDATVWRHNSNTV